MKKMLLIITIILALGFKMKAEIIYTDINPDTVLVTINAQPMYFDFDVDANGTIDFCIAHHESIQFFSAYNGSMVLCQTNPYDYSEPSVIEVDDSINVNRKDWISNYGSINLTERWDGQSNKYIGLKFKRGTYWHYGWLEISIPLDHHNCVVHGFAYNTIPDEGIKAGEISATGFWEGKCISIINIYPNPATEYLYLPESIGEDIDIYDITGMKVLSFKHYDKIDVHNLIPGTYFIKINEKNYKFIKK